MNEDDEYLFLIDAVDEKNMLLEELSDQINSILDTVNNDKRFRLVLTSRYIGSLEFDKRFVYRLARYEIAELTIGKIISYLNIIRRRLNLHTRIIEDLQRSTLFERLPKNPIATVLLAQLLAENKQELPSTMTELYEKYMELALGRWDARKGLQTQQEFETLENVLMDLAEYVLENELELINLNEVREKFHAYLSERNLNVESETLIERAVERADVLGSSRDGYATWFKHRSFAEFLYAKRLLKKGKLQPNLRAFDLYWANTYFFGLGLQKDAPDLLEGLIDLEPKEEGQRLMKMFGLADFLMAAYATPYWVIEKGVYQGALEAAKLYQDVAEGRVASPVPSLPQMHFLYFVQLVMRDNYGYEFLAKALENAATKLLDDDTRTSAYAIFLVAVAYIDAGQGQSFDWLLEDFRGELPLDLRLAVGHEGSALKARNKAIKRLRRNIQTAFKDRAFYDKTKKMYEQPIGSLVKDNKSEVREVDVQP